MKNDQIYWHVFDKDEWNGETERRTHELSPPQMRGVYPRWKEYARIRIVCLYERGATWSRNDDDRDRSKWEWQKLSDLSLVVIDKRYSSSFLLLLVFLSRLIIINRRVQTPDVRPFYRIIAIFKWLWLYDFEIVQTYQLHYSFTWWCRVDPPNNWKWDNWQHFSLLTRHF